MISALTPLEFLSRNAIAYRDCTAEVDGDRRFTYSEMQQRVHSFGAALQQAGIAPGDRVAVLARNGLLPKQLSTKEAGEVLTQIAVLSADNCRPQRRNALSLELMTELVGKQETGLAEIGVQAAPPQATCPPTRRIIK